MEKENQGLAIAKPKKVRKVNPAAEVVPGDESSTFIQLAIKNNAPVEVMEKLFDLNEKVRASRARAAFVVAMADFQSACPIIEKTKKVMNKDGRTVRYQYAPIDAIVDQIKRILAANRLSYRWEVENKPDVIKATAIITHEAGHSESSSFEIPIDNEGFMTAPQKYASALTFAKRYTLCNALGISTGDEDTDATDVNKEPEAKDPKARIAFLLRGLGFHCQNQADYVAAVSKTVQLDLLDVKNYPEIVARLEVITKEKNDDNSNVR